MYLTARFESTGTAELLGGDRPGAGGADPGERGSDNVTVVISRLKRD